MFSIFEPIELLFLNFVLLVLEYQSAFLGVIDGDWLLTTYFFGKNLLTQVVQYVILNSTLYRTAPNSRVVTYLGKITDSDRSPAEIKALRLQHLLGSIHLQSTTLAICSWVRGLKVMISSIRFRNSGRKVFFNISRLALEVMMMMVFVKFTTRPLLSVEASPSSNTCKQGVEEHQGELSGSASKRTTLYGLRRTASVN